MGTHKFWDFTNKPDDVHDFERTIYRIEVDIDNKEDPKLVSVTFVGNRFMTYQVRIMMGAAFRVGFHQMSLDEFEGHIDSKERSITNFKANPEGLNFIGVSYEQPEEKDVGFLINYGQK